LENVDFGDAYLAASASSANHPVASFDHNPKEFKGVKIYSFDGKN